jgi:hypothetical protein
MLQIGDGVGKDGAGRTITVILHGFAEESHFAPMAFARALRLVSPRAIRTPTIVRSVRRRCTGAVSTSRSTVV